MQSPSNQQFRLLTRRSPPYFYSTLTESIRQLFYIGHAYASTKSTKCMQSLKELHPKTTPPLMQLKKVFRPFLKAKCPQLLNQHLWFVICQSSPRHRNHYKTNLTNSVVPLLYLLTMKSGHIPNFHKPPICSLSWNYSNNYMKLHSHFLLTLPNY